MGAEAAAAARAAAASDSSSASPPASAASASGTRRIVGASAVIATRASCTRPSSRWTTAVAPTTAISIWRRYSSRTYALPVPGAGAGTSTETSSSSALAAVVPGPVKSPSTETVRVPSTERRVAEASRQISGPPVSIAGEAFITLPPIVPCARVACEPTIALASARAVNRSRIAGCAAISACVTSAPRRRPSAVSSIAWSSETRWMATSASGSDALPCRAPTTRSVPPATAFAPRASAASASSTVVAVAKLVTPARPPRRAPGSWGAG